MENLSKTPIHVVAAVITNERQEILIAKRPVDSHQGGLWEFPGGKLEENEFPQEGLVRELNEELGIWVKQSQTFLKIRHDYPDKSVLLDVWWVNVFSGEAYGREQQEIKWVKKNELQDYDFPAANTAIVNKIIELID